MTARLGTTLKQWIDQYEFNAPQKEALQAAGPWRSQSGFRRPPACGLMSIRKCLSVLEIKMSALESSLRLFSGILCGKTASMKERNKYRAYSDLVQRENVLSQRAT